ncbi:MAG TPA: hypothetical protein VFF39_15490 [Verrucomicrobiae bacterium]|nr:hypothetical protein [Verrucomicrobiae bacterium]
MKRAHIILVSLAIMAELLLTGKTLCGQNADRDPAGTSITFDRVWDEFTPQKVTIAVSANGNTKYVSHSAAKPPDEADDYETEFMMSPVRRDKLFRYAKEANYFDGDFTFKKHVVASTGKKVLTYTDPVRHFNTAYDYSENKAIQEITSIFQGISNTVEHGRKLKFLRRFDKLGLEAELKGMESAAEGHNLVELQVIAPMLESIAGDSSILNIARQRAQRLLAKANSE